MFGIRYCSKSNLHTAFYSLFFLEESHIEYRVFGIHPTTWCFPSCQNQTIPSSRTFGWSCPFLCSFSRLFRFFRLSPSIRCSYFAFSRLFYICLLRTATGLCNGTKRAEFMGGRLPLCNCLQFGIHVGLLCVVLRVCRIFFFGSVRSLATNCARSRHRRSSPRAFALQKKSRLPLFSASAL